MRILTILLLFPLLMQGQNQNLIFWDSVEAVGSPIITGFNGNIKGGYTRRIGQANSSLERQNSVILRGNWSYRMTLNDPVQNGAEYVTVGLVWNFLPSGSPRGTVGDNTAFSRPPTNVRWFGTSIFIPNDWNDINTVTSVVFSTKAVEDDWDSPSYIATENGRFWIFHTPVQSNFVPLPIRKADLGPVVKGQRIDWILHRNFTARDTGYLEVYRNDTLVYSYRGGNWKDDGNHSIDPYMQTTIYKWAFQSGWSPTPNVSSVTIYYDDIRFFRGEATLQEVSLKSRQAGTPPPVPNQAPVATINPNAVPTNTTSATVIAQSTDLENNITGRDWAYLNGPTTPSLTGTFGDTLRVSGMTVDGEYNFRYIVTDGGGLRDTAFVTIVKSTIRTLIFSDDAEAVNKPVYGGAGANIEQYYTSQFGGANGAIVRTNEQAREGSFSYKLTIRDTTATGATFTARQLVWGFQPPTTPVGIQWQGVSAYLPESMRGDNTPIIGPLQGVRLNQEVMSHWMRIQDGKWYFVHSLWSAGGVYLGDRSFMVGEVEYDKWTDWAVRRNYTNLSTGFIQVYRNKALVYTYTGINYSASGTRPEPYFQMGMFKRAFDTSSVNNKSTVTMYLDNLTFGGSGANINLISPNQAPSASITPIIETDKDTVQLAGLVSDIDGVITTRSWSKVSGPSASIIGTGDTVNAVLSDTGRYTFQLIVTDDKQAVSSALVTFTKIGDTIPVPPTISLPQGILYKGDSAVVVNATTTGTGLTYNWYIDNAPPNAAPILSGANTETVTITNHRPGNYILKLTVTDSAGQTAEGIYAYRYFPIPAFQFIYSGEVKIIYR